MRDRDGARSQYGISGTIIAVIVAVVVVVVVFMSSKTELTLYCLVISI